MRLAPAWCLSLVFQTPERPLYLTTQRVRDAQAQLASQIYDPRLADHSRFMPCAGPHEGECHILRK